MNTFAIAILSYNHPEITQKCIQSVLNLKIQNQIFLIHNGSTEKHIALLKDQFPQISHFVIDTNKGYAGGANFSLSEVFKNYSTALFLTNDVELIQLPNSAPVLFSSVKSYKRKTEAIDSVGGLIDLKNAKLSHRKNSTDTYDSNIFLPYIPGTAFWITKEIFEKLNGFDESFHTYWEDVDFSYRAHLNRIQIGHSNETIIRHKIGKTCHKNDFYTYYLYQRNRKRFMIKHNLTSLTFWFVFLKDLSKNFKFRFRTTWEIIND